MTKKIGSVAGTDVLFRILGSVPNELRPHTPRGLVAYIRCHSKGTVDKVHILVPNQNNHRGTTPI